jgi:hypothetical protein
LLAFGAMCCRVWFHVSMLGTSGSVQSAASYSAWNYPFEDRACCAGCIVKIRFTALADN